MDESAESSAELFRDSTTTFAEYLLTNALTIPRPS